MAIVREVFWRCVSAADFYYVEVAAENAFDTGGGQTFFSLSWGRNATWADIGRFLGVEPPERLETEKVEETVEAAILTDPTQAATLEFVPRYQTGKDKRYRISNQNRQRENQERHPAWTAERGFPAAPDDIATKTDPRMPDLAFLKLVIARDVEGSYFADYVNGDRAPEGVSGALSDLFRANDVVGAGGLIPLASLEMATEELADIVRRSHELSAGMGTVTPEVADAWEETARAARPRSRSGQGFRQSQPEREVIDGHAMATAIAYFEGDGWSVEDRHSNHPYDLFCTRGGESLHVEVKGTTSAGAAVLLTPNEVVFAREASPETALFIVYGVQLTEADGKPSAAGGKVELITPWEVDDHGVLKPTGYAYELRSPPGRPQATG